jgi:hypothetical protein
MKFDQDFKDAIGRLTDKEKDKLILRLLKKDINLANQLYFQLLETRSLEQLRTEIELIAIRKITSGSIYFYSPGVLMMYLREISGTISEHVSTTKDKYGDPYLNCIMLINALQKNKEQLINSKLKDTNKLYTYIVARIFKILTQVITLHEDLQYDFNVLFEELLQEINQIPELIKMTIYHGLNLNWMINLSIPKDISAIQKNLRQQGYLK